MEQLKLFKPEFGEKFEANGKTYIIEKNISIARAIWLNKIEIEMLSNVSFNKIREDLLQVYDSLNAGKFADSSVKIYNIVYGMDKSHKIEDIPILRLCSLFINEEKEDRKEISEEIIDTKINDWQKEGIAIEPFFALALSFLPSVGMNLKQRIQDILQQEKQ